MTQGLYEKFRVERADGRSAPGERHHGCQYFVLDLTHDRVARIVACVYADLIEVACPELAADLWKSAAELMEPCPLPDCDFEDDHYHEEFAGLLACRGVEAEGLEHFKGAGAATECYRPAVRVGGEL